MSRIQLPLAVLLGTLLALVATTGCGEDSREAKLRVATQAMEEAEAVLEEARARLEEREQELAQAQAARDEAREAVREAEDALSEARGMVGAEATDEVLFRTVQKRLLEDEELSSVAIAASVEDGVVTLRGAVPSPDTRDHAVEVALGVAGVREVKSQIQVSPANPEG